MKISLLIKQVKDFNSRYIEKLSFLSFNVLNAKSDKMFHRYISILTIKNKKTQLEKKGIVSSHPSWKCHVLQ